MLVVELVCRAELSRIIMKQNYKNFENSILCRKVENFFKICYYHLMKVSAKKNTDVSLVWTTVDSVNFKLIYLLCALMQLNFEIKKKKQALAKAVNQFAFSSYLSWICSRFLDRCTPESFCFFVCLTVCNWE